jgi:putative ATP-binding cassette transporter
VIQETESMMDASRTTFEPVTAAEAKREQIMPQIAMMVRAFLASPQRDPLLVLSIGICVVVGATAFGQVELNAWNRPFFDALSRKDLGAFLYQLWVFAMIAGGLLVLNVAQVWLNNMTKLNLREGLTRDLLDRWLAPKRAFRLMTSGEFGVNPDQRIHEDTRHLVELSTDLGIGLFQASLLLVTFIGVLWFLSNGVNFTVLDKTFAIPGYMVWCALIYAGTASWLSWRVGYPLIGLNTERYGREAELRFGLVRVNDRIDVISLYGGEADEKERLNRDLDQVLAMMRQLVTGITRLTWVTAGYGWFTIVAPIVVAAPGYFAGDLSLGGLMMAVGAFVQVQQALRWFVDNFHTIADWRATLLRVATFRLALAEMDKLGDDTTRIEVVAAKDDRIIFDDLAIATVSGCTRLSESHVVVEPGDRVLIVGTPGAAKTDLFRAIAGLWPWGCGRISMPVSDGVMFVSQRPYIPPGALRAALAYPFPAGRFASQDFAKALGRLGLAHLAQDLDRVARWSYDLSSEEQQKLAFARLLLHKPRWVLIDEAIDLLNDDSREIVFDVFNVELADTAILNIGRADTEHGFFSRVLHLLKQAQGPRLAPCACARQPVPQTLEAAKA